MDKSPNWCPDCEKETEWLIVPSNPKFAQCKECGHIKEIPLKVDRPRLEEPSIKERSILPKPKRVADLGMALQVVVQSLVGTLLLGSIWLVLAFMFMMRGDLISTILFFILFFATASTMQVYFILCATEEIAERKSKMSSKNLEKSERSS